MKCEVGLSDIHSFPIMLNTIWEDHNIIVKKCTILNKDELNSFSSRQTNKYKRLEIQVLKIKLDKKTENFFGQIISMEVQSYWKKDTMIK